MDEPPYYVMSNGRLVRAAFRPMWQLLPALAPAGRDTQPATCIQDGGLVQRSPDPGVMGERLALKASYSAKSRDPVALIVETGDPDRRYRTVELRPFQTAAELVDLGTSRVLSVKVEPSQGDRVCFARMEIGSLAPLAVESP